jgi:hypothetical protein
MQLSELFLEATAQSYEPPVIDVGDDVLIGKFKNRKAKVTGFAKDAHQQPILRTSKGDQKLFKPRIVKLDTDPKIEKHEKKPLTAGFRKA